MTEEKFTTRNLVNVSGKIAATLFWISLFAWLLFVVWDPDVKITEPHKLLQWAITGFLVWMLIQLIETVLQKKLQELPATPDITTGYAYPQGKTKMTLNYIILLTLVFLALTILGLSHHVNSASFVDLPWLALITQGNREVLLVAVAAGLGSSLATILAFIQHAIYNQDFADRFMPWYLLRPMMGALLGVIFYFLIAGGLLALTDISKDKGLDLHALAGMATLVGFFSRPAIEKLKVVFDAMFSSTNTRDPDDAAKAQKDALAARDATFNALKAEIIANADPTKLKTLEAVWNRISGEQWTIGSGDEAILMEKLKAKIKSKMTEQEKAILIF